MTLPLRALLLALAAGCASTPRPELEARVVPPVPEAAPAADAGAAAVAVVAEALPAVDPCAQGPAHEALAGLEADHVLADRRVGGYPRARERVIELAPLFPGVRAEGFEVLAVTPTDVLPGGALVALVAPVGAAIVRDQQVDSPGLALLTCRPDAGWVLAARPYSLGSDALVQLVSTRPAPLPGGGRGVTVTVYSYFATAESNTTPYIMGAATPAMPVRFPRGASAGVLAVVGTVGERVVAEGIAEYRSLSPLDATGWYPLGDEQVFVRVFRERAPTEAGRWTDGVSATVLGHLGRQGYAGAEGSASPLWLLVGPGEMPAWCTGRPGVRCGPLTVEGQGLDGVTLPYTWVAGAWEVGGAPPPRDLTAPGARWFYAGGWDGDHPPRDPTGRASVTSIPVRANAAQPARPARR